jgi:para-nitrobenzyl esterase
MGVSAGAGITALLLTSPLATGLIDGVILRNPSSLRPLCTLAEAEAAGRVVGDDLAPMRALPPADLLATNPQIEAGARGMMTNRRLRTIVDGWVIPQDEAEAYRSGAFTAVPTIVGSIASEGGALNAEAATYSIPRTRSSLAGVQTTLQLREYLADCFGAACDEAWALYGADADADVMPALAALYGDAMFGYGIRGIARAIAQRQPKTFRYIFSHVGAHTANPPVHGNDTAYAFGTGDFDARDRAVSDAIVAAFSNFAARGDPNGPGAPRWAPYDPARDNYLTFGADFAQGTRWRAEQAEFIERFYRSRAN